MKRKTLFLLPLLLMPLAMTSCFDNLFPNNNNNGSETDKSRSGKYHLNKGSVDLVVGQTFTILLYEDLDDGSVKTFDNVTRYIKYSALWTEDESVATVTESGVITPKKEGSTTLKYRIGQDSPYATILECQINVVAKTLESITVKRYNKKVLINSPYTFKGTVNGIYTTGYSEPLPSDYILADTSSVDTSVLGDHSFTVTVTFNGVTKSLDLTVKVVATEEELVDTTILERSITDFETNSRNMHTTGLPVIGNLKLLVVPIKFTDSDTFIFNYENVKEDINKVFFGTSEDVGYESIKTYYEQESFNKISISGITTDWYEPGHPSTYYYDRDKQDELAIEVRDWYFSTHPSEDIKTYDIDHNGQFDGLYLVYGSYDYKTAGESNHVSKEMWMSVNGRTTTETDINNPTVNRYMWASYDAIYPTSTKALERTERSHWSEDEGSGKPQPYKNLETHVLIHETGHMFGLNDYYTYGGNTSFATEYVMQSNNLNGHDPYSLLLFNWVDPIIVEDSGNYVIGDFQTTHDLLLVTPSWNDNNSPFDEYILIELFAPTGLNYYDSVLHPTAWNDKPADTMNTVGIRMWHVDKRLLKTGVEGYITDPNLGNVIEMSSNTPSMLDEEYQNNLEIYLIRNDEDYNWQTASSMDKNHFFQTDDVFTMSKYQSQFANSTKLNNNQDFPFEIKFKSVDQVTKEAEIEIIRK